MIILFDGVCNLCNGAVNFVINHDKKNVFKFANLQSEFGQKYLKENKKNETYFDSIILVDGDKYYLKSEAIYKIAKHLPFPYSLFSFFRFIPIKLSNLIYDFVANNRYKIFGKRESCRIPTKDLLNKFL